jgi:MarR family transcriptional regulator, lower aerobic nicotinate degradation pathway regulator
MTSTPPYRLEEQVGFLLRTANQRHRALFGRMVRPRLAPTQFAALAALRQHGPLSQNRLGRIAAMDSATIFGVVKRLTERGLVTSDRAEHDARLSMVMLTDEGDALVDRLLPIAAEVTAATLAPLGPEEQEQLLALLARISGDGDDEANGTEG